MGVKVARKFLRNKKAQGDGKAQIAYFGGKGPCCYAAYEVAKIFVSRLQIGEGGINGTWLDHLFMYEWMMCSYTACTHICLIHNGVHSAIM